jgi:hypothetical protein
VKKHRAWPHCCAVAILVVSMGCGGSPAAFTLSNAAVDPNHPCASGSNNAAYDIHATVTGHNSAQSAVSISAVSAVMTLAAVHGGWLQPVGSKYTPDKAAVTPDRIGPGSTAILNLTLSSACTNLAKTAGSISFGDYSISFRFVTSAGNFTISSANRHRIVIF